VNLADQRLADHLFVHVPQLAEQFAKPFGLLPLQGQAFGELLVAEIPQLQEQLSEQIYSPAGVARGNGMFIRVFHPHASDPSGARRLHPKTIHPESGFLKNCFQTVVKNSFH
jgi:hypothetical protein